MQGLNLFYREMGEGPALIIIHGLYGSSDNWITIAKQLASHFHVYLIDQRNHGHSPHHKVHTYQAMCDDLERFIREKEIIRPVLLGHSMGGKTAMYYATSHPDEISALVVVDISPRTYVIRHNTDERFSGHKRIMEALLSLHPEALSSRKQALQVLEAKIPSERVRQFLLKNLVRDSQNHFHWQLNIQVLYDNLPEILKGLDTEPSLRERSFSGFPVLFLRGEQSTYIQTADQDLIHQLFPYADIITIPEAGHWVHAEQPEMFVRHVFSFLLD